RAGASGVSLGPLPGTLLHFSLFTRWEKTHPLQGGVFRLKYRRDRRPGRPLEPVWMFYPKFVWETLQKVYVGVTAAWHLYGVKKRIKVDPNRLAYMDQALTPVTDEEVDTLQLFNQNDAARH